MINVLQKIHFERVMWSDTDTDMVGSSVCPVSPDNDQNTSLERCCIMIIDDSPTIRKIVEICLRRVGYHVIGFPDGITAFQWLAEPHVHVPTLVLLDINLPKINGYQVAQYLQKNYPFIPIVMLTRRNGGFDRLKARLIGAKDYMVKPFQTKNLLDVVTLYTRPGK